MRIVTRKHNSRAMISIENLCFSYSELVSVFDNLNLILGNVSHTCILGPDGAGKSTLAKLLAGILTPQSGKIVFNLNSHSATDLVGYVGSDPDDNLVGITVEDDIIFGLENLGLSEQEMRRRLASAVRWTGLEGMEKRLINSLSGGEKQKVALASMMALGAKLLILDEATAMMDPQARIMLKTCLSSLNQHHGAVIIEMTSIPSDALGADSIILLESGKVICEGSGLEFVVHPKGKEYLSSSAGLLGLMRELNELGVNNALDSLLFQDARSFILKLFNC